MNRIAVIIVAGGSGSRMGAEVPKQFLVLDGLPILMHTIRRFAETLADARTIVVLPAAHIGYWQNLCREYAFTTPHEVCEGGATRFESVRRGLDHAGDAGLVAVHDGVRPLVGREVILRAVRDAQAYGAVIPVVVPVDSLRRIADGGSNIVDRSAFRIVQTPQVFRTEILRKAYRQPFRDSFTDDASVVEADGGRIYLCEGSYMNIKITTPVDIVTAEALLKVR